MRESIAPSVDKSNHATSKSQLGFGSDLSNKDLSCVLVTSIKQVTKRKTTTS